MSPIENLVSKITTMEETIKLMDHYWSEFNGDPKKVVFKIARDLLAERVFMLECEVSRMKDVQYDG